MTLGTAGDPTGAPPPLSLDFLVTPERRRQARRARRLVVLVCAALIALAIVAWVLFPPGPSTRFTLSLAAVLLVVLAVLLLLRLWGIVRKAERYVATDGMMLQLSTQGIGIAGDTTIPWHAVSGIWAFDSAPALRERAQRTVFGAPGRVMLRAGVNTANVTFGVVDVAAVIDPARRIRRFRALPSGLTPGRLELPFGSQFDTAQLHEVLAVARSVLPPEVPVRLADGVMDYAAAWSGVSDDVATIREREAQRDARS